MNNSPVTSSGDDMFSMTTDESILSSPVPTDIVFFRCAELNVFHQSLFTNDAVIDGSFKLSHLTYVNIGVLIFTIISGTIGNLLVFLSMVFEEKLVTCVNGLHGNLALADALNCMLGAFLHLVRFFLNPLSTAFNLITHAELFILHYNITASCLSTIALSFLKYWKLTHPLNKQPCKVIYLAMAVIQISSVLFGITCLFDSMGMLSTCTPSALPAFGAPMWSILYILIPLFLVSLLVSFVLKLASYLKMKKDQTDCNKVFVCMQVQQSASRYDFTGARGAFFLMIALQVVCYLPFVVFYAWCFQNSTRVEAVAETIVTCLLCSCAVNPFLYTLRCHTYRRTLRKIFVGKKDQGATEEATTVSGMGIPNVDLTIVMDGTDTEEKQTCTNGTDEVCEKLSKSPNDKARRNTNLFFKNCACNIVPVANDNLSPSALSLQK